MAENDLFHIMYTCRSMRRLKPDPVPDELIYKVIEAGTQAACGSGMQVWRFVVVTNPESKRRIAAIYQHGWRAATRSYAEAGASLEDKNIVAATYLADHMAEAPVLLFACLRARRIHAERLASPQGANFARMLGGSIYPAVQNILLACRALGLGATLTGVTTQYEDEIKAILGLPENITTYAMIPIGYPQGRFGPVTRLPVEEVTWRDRYGTPFIKNERVKE
ncbi:MAG: nitroreductase family protein [Candidatus Binatia bacterium]